MAVTNLTDALPFLGKRVLIQLEFDDDGELYRRWSIVRIGGVMLEIDALWHAPYFLGFETGCSDRFPNEYFWSDIRSITVIPDSRLRTRSV